MTYHTYHEKNMHLNVATDTRFKNSGTPKYRDLSGGQRFNEHFVHLFGNDIYLYVKVPHCSFEDKWPQVDVTDAQMKTLPLSICHGHLEGCVSL